MAKPSLSSSSRKNLSSSSARAGVTQLVFVVVGFRPTKRQKAILTALVNNIFRSRLLETSSSSTMQQSLQLHFFNNLQTSYFTAFLFLDRWFWTVEIHNTRTHPPSKSFQLHTLPPEQLLLPSRCVVLRWSRNFQTNGCCTFFWQCVIHLWLLRCFSVAFYLKSSKDIFIFYFLVPRGSSSDPSTLLFVSRSQVKSWIHHIMLMKYSAHCYYLFG